MKKENLITTYDSKLPSIRELIEDIRMPTKIETVRAEDEVIRMFLRKGQVSPIVKELNKKYNNMNFTAQDVIEFITEFKSTIKAEANLIKKTAQRRMFKTREGLSQELLDLAILSKKLATQYNNEGDHSSAIQAIKAASDIFFRNAKLEGIMDSDSSITINMKMDKLVQEVSNTNSDFSDEIKKQFSKTIDASFEEVNNGEDSTEE